jgi:hypothetical protein
VTEGQPPVVRKDEHVGSRPAKRGKQTRVRLKGQTRTAEPDVDIEDVLGA